MAGGQWLVVNGADAFNEEQTRSSWDYNYEI